MPKPRRAPGSEIGHIVARASEISGLSRKALAQQAGIAPETLSRMCRRGTGDFAAVSAVARAAGLSLHQGAAIREPGATYESPAASDSPKAEVASLLASLPENVSYEDIQYQLYVLEKVKRGLESVRKGAGVPHAEAKRRLKRWLAR